MSRSKAEIETLIRWDQESKTAVCWTSYEPDANKWRRKGYEVVEVRDGGGKITGWRTEMPAKKVRFGPKVSTRRGPSNLPSRRPKGEGAESAVPNVP